MISMNRQGITAFHSRYRKLNENLIKGILVADQAQDVNRKYEITYNE